MENNKTKVAIIGYGEIGSSLAKVYKEKGIEPMIRDIQINTIFKDVDVLDICLPYTENFIDIVNDYVELYSPKLTIIHSTVPVGTTKKISRPCVHSPVRGVHPNLKEGIQKFVKFIGWNDDIDLMLAEEHYRNLEIIHYPVKNSDSTELAKLTSTTYYGLCIAWHGEMKKMCDKYNIDFDVINKWTLSYNLGYMGLNMQHVVRPNLHPPENEIGGHCIIPNVELLMKQFESTAFNLIMEYSNKETK